MNTGSQITAVILAGGRARRMEGKDKGLLELNGKPLIQHVIERIEPQVHTILISANRNQAEYEKFGYPVVSDEKQGYLGPLAGIAAALQHCTTDLLLVVPCDTPFLPDNLAAVMLRQLQREYTDVCLAHDDRRLQPLIALISCTLEGTLNQSIAAGHLKVEKWMQDQKHTTARFTEAECFLNINSRDDLALAEKSSS
jgi:molybdenum cofactor guanylyltransferase